MNKFEKSIEAIPSFPPRRTSRRGRESEHVARHHAKHEESESDDDEERDGDEAKKFATRDKRVKSSRDGRTDVS